MAENQVESEEEEGGGGPSVGELLAFLRGAPKRRRRAARIAAGIAAAGGIIVAVLKPPIYQAEVRILAQRNATLKDVATRSTRDESPTKGAAEAILQRENMLGIVKDANLVDRWDNERSPVQKAIDSVLDRVRAKPTEDDKLRAIVGVLEKRIMVGTDDMTVTINASWGTPKTAYEVVRVAEKRFFDTRRSSEVGMISDAIEILESHLKTEREKLDQAVADLTRLENAKHATPTASATPSAEPAPDAGKAEKRITVHAPKPTAAPDPERIKLLAEKRDRIAALMAEQARKVNDLNTQITSLRATLTPAHPSIVALERQLELAKVPPEELGALRQQVAQLEAEAADSTPTQTYDPSRVPDAKDRDGGAPTPGASIVVVSRPEDDAETSMAKQRLTNATFKHEELQSRLRAARIELDVAEAAFKYKYSTLTPAEVPRSPKKPAPALIAILGIVVALVLYFVVPTAIDLFCGRFIAAWQAKKLGIPLLGELDPPSPPSPPS